MSNRVLLECVLCRQNFTDPRVLPSCGHTACLQCLQQLVKPADDSLSCPQCSTYSQIPNGGLGILPKNLVIDAMLRNAERRSEAIDAKRLPTPTRQPYCQSWDAEHNRHAKALTFCLQCVEYFCPSCQSAHRNHRVTRDHELFGPTRDGCALHADTPHCDRHPLDRVSLFCNTCHVPICTTCSTGSHRRHDVENLSEAAIRCRASLDCMRHSAYGCMFKVQDMKDELLKTLNRVKQDCKQARKSVKEATTKVMELAQAQEQKLIEEIGTSEEKAVKAIAVNISQYEEYSSNTEQLVGSMDILSSDYKTTVHTQDISRQLEELKEVNINTVEWNCQVTSERKENISPSSLVGNMNIANTPNVSRKAIRTFPLRLKDKYGVTYPTGMMMLHDCLTVIHNQDPNLWIYDKEGRFKEQVPVKGLENPQGMVVVSSTTSQVAITDYGKGKLHLVGLMKDYTVNTHKRVKLDCLPRGITMDRTLNNLLITAEGDSNFLVLDVQGQVKLKVSLPGLQYPRAALATTNGYIVLDSSAKTSRHLKWFSKAGIPQHTYSGCSPRDALGISWNILRDGIGRILITDGGKNRIHLLDPEGNFVTYLLDQQHGLSRPTSSYVDEERGHLFIAHGGKKENRTISVYEYNSLPVTASTFSLSIKINSFDMPAVSQA